MGVELDTAIGRVCGPLPVGPWWLPCGNYLEGWCLVGLPRWHKVRLAILGYLWLIGAQAVAIHQFTEGPYDNAQGGKVAECGTGKPDRDGVAYRWLLCGSDTWKEVSLGIIYFLPGWFVGAALFGSLSDMWGRKKALVIALSSGTVAYLGSAFAPDFWSYAALRILCGFSFGGTGIVSFALGCELVSADWVSTLGAGYFNVIFVFGELILIGMAVAIKWDWRLLTFASAAQCIVLLPLVILVVPESPRWLLANGREKEAWDLLNRADAVCKRLSRAAEAKDNTDTTIYGSGSSSGTTTAASEVDFEDSNTDANTERGGMLPLFTHPRMLALSLTQVYMWMTVGMAYYGLTFIAGDLPGSRYTNAVLLALVEIPGALVGNGMVDIRWLGRKHTCTTLFVLAAAACAIAALTGGGIRSSVAFVGKFAISAVFCALYVYAAELFPTKSRNAGLGLCSQLARVGSGGATGLVLILSSAMSMLVFSFASITAALLCALLSIETNGRPLPNSVAEAVQCANKFRVRGSSGYAAVTNNVGARAAAAKDAKSANLLDGSTSSSHRGLRTA